MERKRIIFNAWFNEAVRQVGNFSFKLADDKEYSAEEIKSMFEENFNAISKVFGNNTI